MNVTGALTIGGTLTHTSTMGVWRLAGCTISGGTLTSTGGTLVGLNASNVIDGVTLNADVDLTQASAAQVTIKNVVTLGTGRTIAVGSVDGSTYGYLFFAPGTSNIATLATGGAASVVLGASSNNLIRDTTGSTLMTIGTGITVTGGVGSIYVYQGGSTLTIAGTVDAASAAKTVTIGNNTAPTTITGTAKASAGILTLAGTWTNAGTFVMQTGGTINLGGTFGYMSVLGARWNRSVSDVVNITGSMVIGTGNTLVLDGQTGPLRLFGGTLTGGTISDSGSSLVCTPSGGVLDGVTIPVGTMLDLSQVNGAICTLNNATTIHGSVLVGKVDGTTYGRLYSSSSTATWSGSGEVLFGASTSNQLQVINASSTLTIASPLRVHGMNVSMYAYGSGSSIINNGTMASDVAGGSFTINAKTFTNNGSLTIGQGSAQTWNFTDNFTQSGTGVLDLSIGGSGAGQFDRLAFTGTSTISLGGTVRITSTNGFVPTPATSLDFLTIAGGSVTGSFATVQGAYSISYNSNKVTAIGLAGLSAPTVTLASAAADPVLSGSIPVTATFSTAVTGFTSAGITVSNATVANFSGSGSSYTFDLVPTVSQGLVQANIQSGAGTSTQLLGSAASAVLQRFFNSVNPTISSIGPNSGPIAGGTSVIISGSGFLAGQTTITIGGATATASSVTATLLAVTTPAGANGPANIVVTVAGRSVTAVGGYTYSSATPSLSSVLPTSEYNALTAFYTATGGASWIAATGWNSSSATSWLGVTESGGHVIGLSLPDNNLTGVIPAALSALPFLQVLDLSGNRLSGTIPPEVTTLTTLAQLSLARNQLVGLIPDTITALTALTGLDIDYNGLYSSGNSATDLFLVQKQSTWAATQTVQPAGLTAVNQGADVLVGWTPIAYTGDGGQYEIGYNTDGSAIYTFSAGNQSADKLGNQFLLTGLTAGTTYYFTVRARTLAHGSQLNMVVSATPVQVSVTTTSPTAPTVTLSSTAGDPSIVSPIPVTVTFSEAMTGFSLAGITVSNANAINFAGSGALYTFDLVPTVTQGSVQASVNAAAASSVAFATGNTASSPLTRFYNGIDPTISSITPTTGIEVGGTAVVITGTDFIPGATSVLIGGATAVVGTVTATSIQLTTPPGTGVADVTVQCLGRSTTTVGAFTYIPPAPTVALSSTAADPTSISPIPLTITFSQPVSGFTLGSLTLVNATAQNLSGSGTTYSCELVPAVAQGTVTVGVPANAVINAQGTGNQASALLSRQYSAPPVVSVSTPAVVASEGAGVSSGSPAAVITVLLSTASTQAISVSFSVTGGTAGSSDYTILTPSLLVFPPGSLSQEIHLALTVDGPDGLGGVPLDESVVLTLGTPVNADLGATTAATLTIVDEEPFTADVQVGTGLLQPIPAGSSGLPLVVSVGQTMSVHFANGIPPYKVLPTSNGRFFAFAPQFIANVNSTVDPYQQSLIVVLAAGPSQIQLADCGGTIYLLDVTATALPGFTLPAPPIRISTEGDTFYAAICPGTSEGLTDLLTALRGRSAADARAFWWDATLQQYHEIDGGDTTGLTSTSAVFLATRSLLNLDFSGGAQPYYQELALPPGWSFVGLPPLSDGITATTTHEWTNLLLFNAQGDQITGNQRDALIGTGAYSWDGATYEVVTTLNSGKGYWIKNNSSPGQSLRLIRFPDGAAGTGVSMRSAGAPRSLAYGRVPTSGSSSGRTYQTVDRGSPPSPPTSAAASGKDKDGLGGCGAGALAASIILMLSFGLRRRRS